MIPPPPTFGPSIALFPIAVEGSNRVKVTRHTFPIDPQLPKLPKLPKLKIISDTDPLGWGSNLKQARRSSEGFGDACRLPEAICRRYVSVDGCTAGGIWVVAYPF